MPIRVITWLVLVSRTRQLLMIDWGVRPYLLMDLSNAIRCDMQM